MNKAQLQEMLDKRNVLYDLYSLKGGLPNEAYCLNENGEHWEVYYSERGVKSQLKQFDNEEEASEYLYNKVIKIIG
jgi:hypothetical protein